SLALPAWIVVAGLASGTWRGARARLWSAILWAIYALGFLVPSIAGNWPAAPVVPTVLLIALAAALLVWQVGGAPAAAPRGDRSWQAGEPGGAMVLRARGGGDV